MKKALFLGRLFGKERNKETQKEFAEINKEQKKGEAYRFGGFRARDLRAIYIPRRGKLKGYIKAANNWGRKRRQK